MRWRKLGCVYAPAGERGWDRSHAYLPTPVARADGGAIRVFYSALDAERRGRVAYVDVDAHDPTRVVADGGEPVLDLGERGAFDDSGVNPSCVLVHGGTERLYYLGWQRGATTPYNIFLGLAERARDDVPFRRRSRAPVLERTSDEPFFRSAATVLHDGGEYRMWYVSTRRWVDTPGGMYPEYVIRSASSADGVAWTADAGVAIDFADSTEFGFGRPWVVRDADRFRMWYSIRSTAEPYRIGYAESDDGREWSRLDDSVGIARSTSGWDSQMICFAAVVDAGGQRLMFYNGNNHGATGFGVAVLEADA